MSFLDSSISKQLSQPSLVRQFDGEYSQSPTTLHILQWNMLAQGYIFTEWKIYFTVQVFIGLSNPEGNFIRVKKETTAYETRKLRILEQMLIRQPDLCGMEEVDIYDAFLEAQLTKNGWEIDLNVCIENMLAPFIELIKVHLLL